MSNSPDHFRALIGLRTLTPLHAGVLGGDHIIDRPIHRDVHTQLPKLSSNALKGALREHGLAKNAEKLLGKTDTGNGGGNSGWLNLTDARLLLFPVRSAAGGWAWVSSPSVLRKFREEAALTGHGLSSDPIQAFNEALANSIDDRAIYAGNNLNVGGYLVIQQHVFSIEKRLTANQVNDWANEVPLLKDLQDFAERFVILSDDNLRELTLRHTEIHTRNKINDATGATGGGLLFSEEHLPGESLLYALAFSMPNKKQQEIENELNTDIDKIRIGGNATLGKGFCRLHWYFPSKNKTTSS
jgi:CRISPR-associated protein Cmr4